MVTSVTPTNHIAGHDTMASVTSHDSRAVQQDSECVSTRRITSLIPDKLKLWTRLVVSLLPRSVSPCLTQAWKVNSRLNPSGRLHSCHLPRPPPSSPVLPRPPPPHLLRSADNGPLQKAPFALDILSGERGNNYSCSSGLGTHKKRMLPKNRKERKRGQN